MYASTAWVVKREHFFVAEAGKRCSLSSASVPAWLGSVTISRLFTEGRLLSGVAARAPYGMRYDPAAAQMVLNILSNTLQNPQSTKKANQ